MDSDSWWKRKLFNEHLVQLQGKDYWFTIDPIFDLQVGKDIDADFNTTFNNTRGFYVQGGLGKKTEFFGFGLRKSRTICRLCKSIC